MPKDKFFLERVTPSTTTFKCMLCTLYSFHVGMVDLKVPFDSGNMDAKNGGLKDSCFFCHYGSLNFIKVQRWLSHVKSQTLTKCSLNIGLHHYMARLFSRWFLTKFVTQCCSWGT